MQWSEDDDRRIRFALASPSNALKVATLMTEYGYEYDDILQEARIACLLAISRKGHAYARSTIIEKACQYRLYHLCRKEGRRRGSRRIPSHPD